jgi:hypothetical protein
VSEYGVWVGCGGRGEGLQEKGENGELITLSENGMKMRGFGGRLNEAHSFADLRQGPHRVNILQDIRHSLLQSQQLAADNCDPPG